MVELTEEQKIIHDQIIEWVSDKNKTHQHKTLAGYAGTGKTTVLSVLSESLYKMGFSKAFCTFTGKASQVLKDKMRKANSIFVNDTCSTIHSLVYEPILENGEIVDWALCDSIAADIIILDEASMVGKDLWNDLLSFGLPILCCGDQGQLEPIGEDSFNLVSIPDFRLTTIHRQAKGNPIIKLSFKARNQEYIEMGVYGKGVAKIEEDSPQHKKIFDNLKIDNDLVFLCGTNKTRIKLNRFAREKLGFDMFELPAVGERVICLKNNSKSDMMNGQQATVDEIEIINDDFLKLTVTMDGKDYHQQCLVLREGFGQINYSETFKLLYEPRIKDFVRGSVFESVDVFDFGYSITIHKSQGSGFKRVILYSERNSHQTDEQFAKMLYTGITRAEEKLLIIE